jgi:hypothetical protein
MVYARSPTDFVVATLVGFFLVLSESFEQSEILQDIHSNRHESCSVEKEREVGDGRSSLFCWLWYDVVGAQFCAHPIETR